MIQPASLEELASLVEKAGKKVFLFVADWCGDCRYIYPALPEIEETNPEFDLYSNGPRSVYGFGQTLGCLRNS
ncbi:thioredoxin family protein [Streptococcus pneumoniae]|nr:thioredoxin family protein [Streptococcus pneumoniae]